MWGEGSEEEASVGGPGSAPCGPGRVPVEGLAHATHQGRLAGGNGLGALLIQRGPRNPLISSNLQHHRGVVHTFARPDVEVRRSLRAPIQNPA